MLSNDVREDESNESDPTERIKEVDPQLELQEGTCEENSTRVQSQAVDMLEKVRKLALYHIEASQKRQRKNYDGRSGATEV